MDGAAQQGAGGDEDLPFEEALARLERAVEQLERGELTLDEALKAFEEGVRMARICSRRLEQAEARLYLLLEQDGAERAVPFEPPPLRPSAGTLPEGGSQGGQR